jgi:hypothetical protein
MFIYFDELVGGIIMEDNVTNLINTLKNTLNNQSDSKNNDNHSSNINITPEMVQNLAKNLQNNLSSKSDTKNESVNSNPENTSDSNHAQKDFSIDMENIMKIKSIMETLNKKDDPRSNLLYSLKPYLRESRQKKIDQYVNLLKITEVSGLFKKEKGE